MSHYHGFIVTNAWTENRVIAVETCTNLTQLLLPRRAGRSWKFTLSPFSSTSL